MNYRGIIKEKLHKIYVITAGILIFSLICGCNVPATGATKKTGLRIVVSSYPIYEWVSMITRGVDGTDLSYILYKDIHDYELTDTEKEDIKTCDLFIYVGGPSDKKLEEALKSSKDQKVINLMKACKEGAKLETDDETHIDDEHIWMSLTIAQHCVSYLADQISELDKDNEPAYLENATSYIEKLTDLREYFGKVMDEFEGNTLIFADKFPFTQMMNEYGCDYLLAGNICPKDDYNGYSIIEIKQKLAKNSIKCILTASDPDSEVIAKIRKAAGEDIPVYRLYSIEKPEETAFTPSEEATYYSMMYDNMLVFEDMLTKKGLID